MPFTTPSIVTRLCGTIGSTKQSWSVGLRQPCGQISLGNLQTYLGDLSGPINTCITAWKANWVPTTVYTKTQMLYYPHLPGDAEFTAEVDNPGGVPGTGTSPMPGEVAVVDRRAHV